MTISPPTIPPDVLEALHQGRAPKRELNETLASQVLGLMQAGALPWPPAEAVWAWSGRNGEVVLALEAVMYDCLPPDFNQWHLADQIGWTVAHMAAQRGHLPPNFDQWHLATPSGRTVAHVAAWRGHLPPDFDQWSLAMPSGWTVAHVAAENGHLPPDFDQWSLATPSGRTVAEVALEYGCIDQVRYEQIMLHIENMERTKAMSSLSMHF